MGISIDQYKGITIQVMAGGKKYAKYLTTTELTGLDFSYMYVKALSICEQYKILQHIEKERAAAKMNAAKKTKTKRRLDKQRALNKYLYCRNPAQ